MRRAPAINLTDADRRVLEQGARGRRTPARQTLRAKIVLLAAEGLENQEIASRQLRHAQASGGAPLAGASPSLPPPLHADVKLVVERRRRLLCSADAPPPSTGCLPFCTRSDRSNRKLCCSPRRDAEAIRVDRISRSDSRQGRPGPRCPRHDKATTARVTPRSEEHTAEVQ